MVMEDAVCIAGGQLIEVVSGSNSIKRHARRRSTGVYGVRSAENRQKVPQGKAFPRHPEVKKRHFARAHQIGVLHRLPCLPILRIMAPAGPQSRRVAALQMAFIHLKDLPGTTITTCSRQALKTEWRVSGCITLYRVDQHAIAISARAPSMVSSCRARAPARPAARGCR